MIALPDHRAKDPLSDDVFQDPASSAVTLGAAQECNQPATHILRIKIQTIAATGDSRKLIDTTQTHYGCHGATIWSSTHEFWFKIIISLLVLIWFKCEAYFIDQSREKLH